VLNVGFPYFSFCPKSQLLAGRNETNNNHAYSNNIIGLGMGEKQVGMRATIAE
jgi:hypothetical protein